LLLPPSAARTPCWRSLRPDDLPHHVRLHLLDEATSDIPVSGYVYDLAVARERARTLRAALPTWASLLFAVKANAFRPVLEAFVCEGGVDGFEVASVAEARLAADVMGPARQQGRLVAAGPAKYPALLHELVDAGIDVIHAESPLELARLSEVAVARGARLPVGIRVNPPGVAVEGTLAMGGRSSAFGIVEPDVPAALELAASLPGLDVVGFHVHAVCGNRDARTHAAYLGWCLDWAVSTASTHGLDLRWLDVGGGLGVDYDGDGGLSLDVLAEELDRLRPPVGLEVALEPGRWLAADCGWYAAEVVDVKRSYGHTYVVVRGGIGGFALPGTEEFPFPVVVLPVDRWPTGQARPEAHATDVTVVGELCTPEDVLVRDVVVEHVRAGDLIVIPKAGAYGWEFALQSFLGHPRATRTALDAATAVSPDPTLEASR
jgi:2-[(L-alanin-3-ylcarbamoyl)methyl]-2-hydroxybutanedioate decarboxylase